MKINKFFIIGLVSATLGFTACEKNDDINNKKRPIERLREAQTTLKTNLTDSEYGWVVNFFPSKDSYGGYYLWMDFFNDNSVDVRSDLRMPDLNVSSEDYNFVMLSTFALNFPYQGKVHHFIKNNPGMHKTDIEFLYSRMDGEDIIFKGHTTGREIRFRKATQELKDNYLEHDTMRQRMNSYSSILIVGSDGPKVVSFSKIGDGRIFSLSEQGHLKDPFKQSFGVSCGSDIVVLSEPILVDNVEISEFTVVDGKMIGEKDGKKIIFI